MLLGTRLLNGIDLRWPLLTGAGELGLELDGDPNRGGVIIPVRILMASESYPAP